MNEKPVVAIIGKAFGTSAMHAKMDETGENDSAITLFAGFIQ